MQRHLKKLKKLTVIILGFSIVSCGGGARNLPDKPSLDACKIIMEIDSAFCVNNLNGREYEIPLSKTDRYVAFSEKDYQMLLQYIKLLQMWSPKKVRKQLEAFHWIEQAHQYKVKEVNGRNP